jgi:hypothetical protein
MHVMLWHFIRSMLFAGACPNSKTVSSTPELTQWQCHTVTLSHTPEPGCIEPLQAPVLLKGIAFEVEII